MFPDNADWLHGPDSNHDPDVLRRSGEAQRKPASIRRESLFPLELTSAGTGASVYKSSVFQNIGYRLGFFSHPGGEKHIIKVTSVGIWKHGVNTDASQQ